MVDLTEEMAQLWSSLRTPPQGHARVIQFAAATGGEGTSTVAREFARYAADHVQKAVWLVDLDLTNAPQYFAVSAEPGRFGLLGRQTAASPDGSAFFTVQPPGRGADGQAWPDARFLVAHPAGGSRLWVTRFRRENMRPDQAAHILPTGDYWNALRQHADLIVVDAPAADRSSAAITVAPFMDFTVLVVAADEGDAAAPMALKDSILGAGGRCAGLVFNRAQVQPPGFLRSILP
jgi:Mrp family chromosome partitioning ATPase